MFVIPNIDASPEEVAQRLEADDEDFFILDVRNEDDYEEWHIDGSHSLPIYDQLLDENYIGLEASLDELPEDEEIIVVCVAGVTSARAAEFLRDQGYDAKSVAGGMNGWGRLHRTYDLDAVEGVTQIVRPGTGCISYLVYDGEEALVIDPTQYVDKYLNMFDERDLTIVGVADTHAHADRVSGARQLADELDVPYYLHDADTGNLDDYTAIEEGESLQVGDRSIDVLATPGHTPGSVSFRYGDALLSGDTLFIRSVGRPDLEDDDEDAIRTAARDLFDSLDRLLALPNETAVLPGHFSDEGIRPLAVILGDRADGELLDFVTDGDEEAFVETIVESLADKPANYNQIKQINWGKEPLTEDAEALELGPNNCAAN